ncbi:MAG: DUF4124 domain-containing protein [Moraxellaceae bacterium]|nr:DUF4124 domain-containing protein [Moraxellaceae bacterium]
MNRLHVLALLGLFMAGTAQADIYKCTDDAGHVTYTNDKPGPGQKNCTLMSREQSVSTVTMPKRAPAASTPTPATFPKVDGDTQRARDNDRRKILETELGNEEKLLEEAKKALAEQESIRNGDEKNYQRVLDRLQPFKDKVALHERNTEAIRKEIANLR